MKIVTWNVNGIRAVTQKGFHDFWEREKPDILCIQETKAHPDQLHGEMVTPKGWESYWSAAQRPGYSGVATFCKETPKRVTYGIHIPKFDTEGRIVMTEFKDFSLYNIYFPNGGSGQERHDYKQEFLKRLQQHLAKRLKAGDKLVVVGDYNVAYMDIDVYNPTKLSTESGFLPEERQWMVGFLEGGFIDSFRYFHPEEKDRYSWWSYFQNARQGNRGWRIDHICVSRNLEKKLKSCDILDAQTGSDHCPVVMELKL
jgi:exodeoxyribonuclease-3